MVLTWEASGKGECSLSLEDAQHLALEAGFEFQGATEAMPLARRADLQGETVSGDNLPCPACVLVATESDWL